MLINSYFWFLFLHTRLHCQGTICSLRCKEILPCYIKCIKFLGELIVTFLLGSIQQNKRHKSLLVVLQKTNLGPKTYLNGNNADGRCYLIPIPCLIVVLFYSRGWKNYIPGSFRIKWLMSWGKDRKIEGATLATVYSHAILYSNIPNLCSKRGFIPSCFLIYSVE